MRIRTLFMTALIFLLAFSTVQCHPSEEETETFQRVEPEDIPSDDLTIR
jgi:hypothetical protein